MTSKIVVAVVSLLLVLPMLATAQPGGGNSAPPSSAPSGDPASGQDTCPPPTVDIFDLAIPPNPVAAGTKPASGSPEAAAYLHWLDLTTAYGGVSAALINNDPSRDKIEYVDVAIANAASGGKVKNYNPGFNTAPAGAVSGVDYLVTGQITGTEGAYAVSVSMQDATTRAEVAAGHATFQKSLDSMTATQSAAAQLTPALGKIRAYQQKLKQQSSDMAIAPPNDQPEITPAQHSLKSGQSTTVSISLRDCDGLPLAHRALKLKATHGTITPNQVVTDAAGRAQAKFTATSAGAAMIQADYGPYETVTHKRDQRRGTAAIAVATSGLWQVTIDASWSEKGSIKWRSGINSEEDHASKQASTHAVEIVDTNHTDPLTNSNDASWNVLDGHAQASASAAATMLEVLHLPHGGECRTATSFDGSTAHGLPGVTIIHGDPLVVDFQFEVEGTARETFHCSPTRSSNEGDSTSAEVMNYQIENSNDWQGSCRRDGDAKHGYNIVCNVSKTLQDHSVLSNAAPLLSTITGQLHITLTPL